MTHKRTLTVLALPALLATAPATAQIDFSAYELSFLADVEDIEADLSPANGTSGIDGVAIGPGTTLFAIHRDTNADEILFSVDTATGASSLVDDLSTSGLPANAIFESGFVANAAGTLLYFAYSDPNTLEVSLVEADISDPGNVAFRTLLTGGDLDDLTDHAILPTGEIVGVRGADGVGIINPADATPTWTEVVSEADLLALLPGTPAEAPAEAVGVNPDTGDVYVFAHDELETFLIENILDSGTRTVTRLTPPGWAGVVDLHDIVADANGVLYGFDELGESIVVWDGTSSFTHDLDEIAEELELLHGDGRRHGADELAVTLWRGLAVRAVSPTRVELYIAINDDEHGIIQLAFTPASASVTGWELYD